MKTNMFKKIKYLINLFVFIGFLNCTGFNYFSGYNPYNNTNPTPEYSHGTTLLLKGGYLFHMNNGPGGIGINANTEKIGESCSSSYMYLVSVGDSTIETAKKKANITKISSVNYEQFAILMFVFHKFCTTVTGE
jgi:hypothetical protein